MYNLADFEHDTEQAGVHWEHFVTAVGIYVYMQDKPPTVADAMLTFNASGDAVRSAVNEHPWLCAHWVAGVTDPRKQFIESDGE